jgi:uncharacterized protein DUF4058
LARESYRWLASLSTSREKVTPAEGKRPWPEENLPDSPYLAALIRARHIQAEVWPIGLRERLPILPVPLRQSDPDVPLDVQAALNTLYDEARYALTLDYDQPPPEPPLSEADAAWAAECITRWREQ